MIVRSGACGLALLVLLGGSRARATTIAEPPTAAETGAGDAGAGFADAHFGPRYAIEEIRIAGNRKTERSLIAGELAALGLAAGATVDASDGRVEAARLRLLSMGYFLDVRLALARGSRRGGAILLVEVEERGTIVINDLFLATSRATLFWAGADVAETNFLGRGINLGAAFVGSTTPLVPDAHPGVGVRLHVGAPPLGGPNGLALSITGLYNDGSEFYRSSGADDEPAPDRFVATRVRRAGGALTIGKLLPAGLRASVSFREEELSAQLPPLETRALPGGGFVPIDFMVRPNVSRVATAGFALDYDSRSDPVLPRSGARVGLAVDGGSALTGSDYGFVKAVLDASFYRPLPHGHALGLHLFAGAVGGDAPYFDRFFVGDLNLLLPRRALGINFSTQPSPNLLGADMARHRYDNYAGRVLVEYAIPIWRRRGVVYGGDAFAAVGVMAMASDGGFTEPGPVTYGKLPIDLTGDVGLRLDTYVGVFTISVANALSRASF
jgi:outer membrane protein insertion porin family